MICYLSKMPEYLAITSTQQNNFLEGLNIKGFGTKFECKYSQYLVYCMNYDFDFRFTKRFFLGRISSPQITHALSPVVQSIAWQSDLNISNSSFEALSGNVFFDKNRINIGNEKAVDHLFSLSFSHGTGYSPWIRDGEYILIPRYNENWTKLEQLGIFLLVNYFDLIAIERNEVLIYQLELKENHDG
jgi:hypothetical protein